MNYPWNPKRIKDTSKRQERRRRKENTETLPPVEIYFSRAPGLMKRERNQRNSLAHSRRQDPKPLIRALGFNRGRNHLWTQEPVGETVWFYAMSVIGKGTGNLQIQLTHWRPVSCTVE